MAEALMAESLSESLARKRDQLLELIRSFGRCAVALSGGVDSAVVAKAAFLALGDQAVAVTGASASLATGELEEAIEVARQIGIRHEVMPTKEFENPEYLRNAPDRCYHCKTELYSRLEQLAAICQPNVLLNGANLDDAADYRPGMRAASEHHVRSPLMECGLTKGEVRELAAGWNLKVWDKPASPCLSSRVAYGEEVTPARLEMIDRAERFLRQHGFHSLRVRYHRGDLARIEVELEELARMVETGFRHELVEHLLRLGFKFVTLDLGGYRSGSLNSLLSLSTNSQLLRADSRPPPNQA